MEKIPKDCINAISLLSYERFRFLYFNSNNPNIDAGFTNKEHKETDKFLKDRLKIEEQCKYLFHIAIDGNDWASSLPWQLMNYNVVLIPYPFKYFSIFNIGLIPYKHFIPISHEFNDIDEILEKLMVNHDLCRYVSENAHKYMMRFLDEALVEEYKKQTIKTYCKLYNN